MSWMERYADMLRQKNTPFVLLDGGLFVRRAGWIAPVGPADRRIALDPAQGGRKQACNHVNT